MKYFNKIKKYKFLISITLFSSPVIAMLDEENQESSYKIYRSFPDFVILPIGEYLTSAKDFWHFALTEKKCYQILKNHKDFFLPEDHKKITQTLINIPLDQKNITEIAFKWQRTPRAFLIHKLRECTKFYDKKEKYYSDDMQLQDLKRNLNQNFQLHLKILEIRNIFKDPLVKQEFKEILSKKIDDVVLSQIFYSKNPSLKAKKIYKIIRKQAATIDEYSKLELTLFYENGEGDLFSKNLEKSNKWRYKSIFQLSE